MFLQKIKPWVSSKELRKAIYTRSRFRKRFLKNSNEISSKLYKQQKNRYLNKINEALFF